MDEIKVMIVDDETDFRQALTLRLGRRNIKATGVASGEEALAALPAADVDVVLLDVKMPGIGGIETFKQLRKICPEVEVIMLTGHANVEVALECMEMGAFDYLMKPMNIDELLYKLQDAFQKKKLRNNRTGG